MNTLQLGALKIYYDDKNNRFVFKKERPVSNGRTSYDYVYVDIKDIDDLISFLASDEVEKENSKMTLREENMDLFTVPQGYYLAHCISADFALGAGIAKQFSEIYNMRNKLINLYNKNDYSFTGGTALLVDNVFNLVTKEKAYGKPTYDSLKESLYDMKQQMEELMITKLAIPQIGAGLDRLEWEKVKDIIVEVFNDMDVEILVCII